MTKPALSPKTPGWQHEEATSLLAMAYAVGLIGPAGKTPPEPANEKDTPIPGDDGKTHPYPVEKIWPVGWEAAITDQSTPQDNWNASMVMSQHIFMEATKTDKVNTALLSYNSYLDAYALAFAGTENLGGVQEDLLMLMVTAQELTGSTAWNYTIEAPLTKPKQGVYTSEATYASPAPSQPKHQPTVQQPQVHLGFRVALESMTVNAHTRLFPFRNQPISLIELFKSLNKAEIDLYITGHSLGAPIASLCAAWLRHGAKGASDLEGIKFNVKCYTFASPKVGNTAYACDYDRTLANEGFSYRVVNSLDTVPQLPPTYESTHDLNNPMMYQEMIRDDVWLDWLPVEARNVIKVMQATAITSNHGKWPAFGSLDFTHVGSPVVLQGEYPVVYEQDSWPASLFPASNEPKPFPTKPKGKKELIQQWWQHWPYIYATYMNEIVIRS